MAKQMMSARIESEVWRRMRQEAVLQGVSVASCLESACLLWLGQGRKVEPVRVVGRELTYAREEG